MKKFFLLLFAFCSISVFASLQDSFTYSDGVLLYKGRQLFCPTCRSEGFSDSVSFEVYDDSAFIFCNTCGEINFNLTEAEFDDYAWGVADDMSESPFFANDQVSSSAQYHGTKNISSGGGSSSGQDQNDSGEGGNTQGQGGGDNPSLIPEIFSFSRLVDVCIIGFSSFIGVCLGGFVLFLVFRRSVSKIKMIDKK